jgi:hypothetical protein
MDEQLPAPGQLLLDILTLGGFVLLGFIIWVIAKDIYERMDQWLWKRRRERWDRQNKADR